MNKNLVLTGLILLSLSKIDIKALPAQIIIYNYSFNAWTATIGYGGAAGVCAKDNFQVVVANRGKDAAGNSIVIPSVNKSTPTPHCCPISVDLYGVAGDYNASTRSLSTVGNCDTSVFNIYTTKKSYEVYMTKMLNSGYKHTIKNSTNSQLIVTLVLATSSCDNQVHVIEPGRTGTFYTNLCCLKYIYVEATEGKSKGKVATGDAEATGFGIGCRNQNFEVKQNIDNSLIVIKP